MIEIKEKPTKIIGGIEYFDTFSVSRILGLDPFTTRVYFKKNFLKGVKIGKGWYLSRDNLKFFIINGRLKTTENMDYKDYKTVESGLVERVEKNLEIIDKQIKEFKGMRSTYATANLKRRYEELKQTLEEYKKDPMTQKDYDTII